MEYATAYHLDFASVIQTLYATLGMMLFTRPPCVGQTQSGRGIIFRPFAFLIPVGCLLCAPLPCSSQGLPQGRAREEVFFSSALSLANKTVVLQGFKNTPAELACPQGFVPIPLGSLGFYRDAPQGWACAREAESGDRGLSGKACFADKPTCQGKRRATLRYFSDLGSTPLPKVGHGQMPKDPWIARKINDTVLGVVHFIEKKNARGFIDRYSLHVFSLSARRNRPGHYLEIEQIWTFHDLPKVRFIDLGRGSKAFVFEAPQDEAGVDALWVAFDAGGRLATNTFDNYEITSAREMNRITVERGWALHQVDREQGRKSETFVFSNGQWLRRELFEREKAWEKENRPKAWGGSESN